MEKRKKFTVGILLLLTILLAGVSIYVGLNIQQNQSGEDSQAGTCAANQNWCGGCINGCRQNNKTCNQHIDAECKGNGCAGEGTFPASGESCCGGLVKCPNGRCGANCGSQTSGTTTGSSGSGSGSGSSGSGATTASTCKTGGQACTGGPGRGTCCTNLNCANSKCVRTTTGTLNQSCSPGGLLPHQTCANGLVCDATYNRCVTAGTTGGTTGTCSTDTNCNSTEYCSGAGRCTNKKESGTCSRAGECASNICTNGTCGFPNTTGSVTGSSTGGSTGGNLSGPPAGSFGMPCSYSSGTNDPICGGGTFCIQCAVSETNPTGQDKCGTSTNNVVSIKAACDAPDLGSPIAACGGAPLRSFRCANGYSGSSGAGGGTEICTTAGWTSAGVSSDACGASCNNPSGAFRFENAAGECISGTNGIGGSCSGNRICIANTNGGYMIKSSGFIGCGGTDNCFNVYQNDSGTTRQVFENTSCGAKAICSTFLGTATPPVTSGTDTGTTTTSSSSTGSTTVTPPPTPYCGDAVCRAGELCERVSPGASQYRVCGSTGVGPSGSLVEECRGIVNAAPSAAGSCSFCGDGILNGPEQCDYAAPGAEDCNEQCQNVSPVCLGLDENGPNPLRTGTGNFMEYTLRYTKAEVGDPFPNIKLRVGTSATPVGRDANTTTAILVSPNVKPSSTDTNNTKTYKFVWEAAQVNGTNVADGSYDVRVLLDGTEASLISTSACQKVLAVDSVAPQEPLFTVVKAGAQVCEADGDARIDYTITVRNIGPVQGVIDQVTDTLDSDIVSRSIVPTAITPTYGTHSNGVITWIGTVSDRTYTANQTKTFTYSITIPESSVVNFLTAGVSNQVVVRYDTPTTNDNTTSFDLLTDVTCQRTVVPYIPNTAFGDESTRYIMFALLFTIAGLITYRLRLGQDIGGRLTRFIYIKSPLTSYEGKVLVGGDTNHKKKKSKQ